MDGRAVNRPKNIGTAFESGLVRYLRGKTGDMRIRRLALAGTNDQGDIGPVYAHGCRGTLECKSHKKVTPALIEKWKDETLRERGNADADFAALVIHVSGRDGTGKHPSFGQNRVLMTLEDLMKLCVGITWQTGTEEARRWREACGGQWVETTVDGFVWLIHGVGDGE